jgi:hypothetical protein
MADDYYGTLGVARDAGVADGDQITVAVPEGWAVLTVRVSVARKP